MRGRQHPGSGLQVRAICSTPRLIPAVDAIVEDRPAGLVIDASALAFCDVATVRALAASQSEPHARAQWSGVAGMPTTMERVFALGWSGSSLHRWNSSAEDARRRSDAASLASASSAAGGVGAEDDEGDGEAFELGLGDGVGVGLDWGSASASASGWTGGRRRARRRGRRRRRARRGGRRRRRARLGVGVGVGVGLGLGVGVGVGLGVGVGVGVGLGLGIGAGLGVGVVGGCGFGGERGESGGTAAAARPTGRVGGRQRQHEVT